MAPLSFTLATPTPTATSSYSPFFSRTPTHQPHLKKHVKQTRRFQVSCNVSSDEHEKPLNTNPPPQRKLILSETSPDWQNVDRRNLLLGLGGLYSTVNLTDLPSAFANPITSPTIGPSLEPSCKPAGSGFNAKFDLVRTTRCCPPASKNGPEKNYVIPKTRIRKPIHNNPDDVKKYQKALEKMRALPDDDPRSFTNQAKIHCAYCNGSYMQDGKELQIHNSWLFFPFHRWYLYFYERILGDLIGDPNFALPYWNWDNPKGGMVIPDLFIREMEDSKSNSLYDKFRNQDHIKNSAVVDLDFHDPKPGVDQQEINLATMNRQMMRNSFDATSFFGGRYVAGNKPIQRGDNVVGSIEAGCHTAVHRWVGRTGDNNHEDMGNFYSAGYDPLFYVHHANVDRMWTLWNQMGGKEPTHEDWGNASYVFYDEKQNPVRVYNKDAASVDNLGYQYSKSETPWTDRHPRSRCNRPGFPVRKSTETFPDKTAVEFPLRILDNTVRLQVPRPAACINRTAEQKEKEREILCFYGIMFDGTSPVKFDVLVNECDTEFTACDSENVGSFSALPHSKGGSMGCKTGMRYSISELLEETGAEGAKSITVTIKPPKNAKEKNTQFITIEDIEIRLIPVIQKE